LILRKISKFDATRCQILILKCKKIDFRWGSASDPAGGAYSAPPDPLAVFKGPTSKRRARERDGRGSVSINLLLYSYLTSGYQNVSLI